MKNILNKKASRRSLLALSALSSAMLMTGCLNLAPAYEEPAAPSETAEKWAVSPASAGVKEAELVTWEKFFLDPRLKEVIRITLENNRDLRQSVLEVERLRQQYRVSRADLFPTISAGGSVTNSRSSVDSILPGASRVSHTYAANLGMTSYELDFFGRVRNQNEQALQSFFKSEDARRSAQNTLIAEVATVWLSIGADQALLDLANDTLASQTESYKLVEQSFKAGASNQLELSQAQTSVSTAKASVQSALNSLTQDKNALRLLMGTALNEELLPKKLELGATMPATLPAGLPSEILLLRPDIAQAEHTLRSANASIGAARAAFFPRVTLTSSIGTLSADASNLFEGGRGTWSFAPSISIPIFTGGANTANLEAAKVAQKQAVAAYEQAIQSAFREVNDALSDEATLQKRLDAQNELVASWQTAYDLSQQRYKHGVDSFLTLLDSQRSLFSAQQSQISTSLSRAVSRVTLYKVLGGGQFDSEETAAQTSEKNAS